MVDRWPRAVARCADADDVIEAIGYGRERDLELGVRCGGHSVLGLCVPDGGLMLDLTPMGGVRVDPERRHAWVQGGALLGALDRVAMEHGLTTTAGNVSHTGVGGLTLGGGMGWLARQFGLSCDNVAAFELITAEGRRLRVDEASEPELFWGLRGGGGNFGVVSEFEFRLHPVATRAHVVELFFALEDAAPVLRGWRDQTASAPRAATFTAWVGDSPRWSHGPVASVGFVWAGAAPARPRAAARAARARHPGRGARRGALLRRAATGGRHARRPRAAPLLEGQLLPLAAGRGDRRVPRPRHGRRPRRPAARGLAAGLRRRDRRRARRRQRLQPTRRGVRVRRLCALGGPRRGRPADRRRPALRRDARALLQRHVRQRRSATRAPPGSPAPSRPRSSLACGG